MKRRCSKADEHYNRTLIRRLLIGWRQEAMPQLRELNKYVEEKLRIKQTLRCAELWSQWRFVFDESRRERRNTSLALALHSKHLLNRVGICLQSRDICFSSRAFSFHAHQQTLKSWRSYVQQRQEKRDRDQVKLEACRLARFKLIGKWVFQMWSQRTEDIIASNMKHRMAAVCYERRLKMCAYSEWRALVAERSREKARKRQADLFLEMKLKTEAFYTWCIKYKIECEMREKKANALLLWSLNVQRRCFVSWLDWCRQQKVRTII